MKSGPGRVYCDQLIASAVREIDAISSPTASALLIKLTGLFDRKTFRHESTSKCAAQLWDHRLHTALQTFFLLKDYQGLISEKAPEQFGLYQSLIREVDRYCDKMAGHLFDFPVDLVALSDLVGTDEFLGQLPQKKFFPGGLPEAIGQVVHRKPRHWLMSCHRQPPCPTW